MKITVISPATNLKNEPETITELFENGLTSYHIRKPTYSKDTLSKYLEKIPERFHDRIVVHSHHALVRKFNLSGVHYSDRDFGFNFRNWWREKMIASKAKNIIKTTSYRKLAALYEEKEMSFDYVFLMPVFNSITGCYQSGYYEDELKRAIQKTKEKIIVLGGVSIDQIEKVTELGFYGMAFSSSIWNKEDPKEEFQKIMVRCRELGITVE